MGENQLIKVPGPHPVVPLDPVWLTEFLSVKTIDKKMLTRMSKAISKYHNACSTAAEKLKAELDKL